MSNVRFLIEAEHNLLSAVEGDLLPAEARLVRAGADLTATQSYVYAAWRAAQLDEMYHECECRSCTDEDEADACEAQVASLEADDARDVAREAWLASDEPREWRVSDDSAQDTLYAVAPDDASDAVEAWLTGGDWDASEGQLYLVAYAVAIDPVTGEAVEHTRVCGEATIEQPEPDCEGDEEHDWCAPHSVVGGLRENPGVYGAGAGIRSRQVCAHCGAYSVYESARQDSGTGRYYGATSYEDADEDSLAWVARRAARLAAEQAEDDAEVAS